MAIRKDGTTTVTKEGRRYAMDRTEHEGSPVWSSVLKGGNENTAIKSSAGMRFRSRSTRKLGRSREEAMPVSVSPISLGVHA